MPDLLEPAAPRGRDRAVTAPDRTEEQTAPAPREAALVVPQAGRAEAPLLFFDHVSKWYGPVIGVNQVTLELRPGITGLVGANGAGKTTLMRLIAGLLRPDVGSVAIRGLEAWSAAAKRYVGYCPEIDTFYEEMSGRQFVGA